MRRSIVDVGPSNTRHFHTRQVDRQRRARCSPTAAPRSDGAWDTERLRYNDFYGALGWKGINSDLYGLGRLFPPARRLRRSQPRGRGGRRRGNAEALFFDRSALQDRASIRARASTPTTPTSTRLQVVHNYYVDDTTTITSRLYGFDHRRDRYQNFEGEDPTEADEDELPRDRSATTPSFPKARCSVVSAPIASSAARCAREFADRPFVGGLTQDIQTGVRYEYNDFTNRNFFGDQGQILEDGDEGGLDLFDRDYRANAVSRRSCSRPST